MPLVGGAIVPHAPLLLEAISGERVAGRVGEIAEAVRDLRLDADAIVFVSPHGNDRGIYLSTSGDLDAFGRPGVDVTPARADDLAAELGALWDAPQLDEPLDHGIVTPLALGFARAVPMVAISLSETKDGVALAEALDGVARRSERVALVASAHLGAALTPRAPIPQRDEAVALEEEVLGALTRDLGILVDRADELSTIGASCGAGPLAALGHAFAGKGAQVVAYSREFGVGYLVARVDA